MFKSTLSFTRRTDLDWAGLDSAGPALMIPILEGLKGKGENTASGWGWKHIHEEYIMSCSK